MDELIDFLVIVLPTVIALLSVYVSIKLTRGEKHQMWWGLILALGVGTSALTWVSQANARKEHARELNDVHGKLDKSLLGEQYMRGQLDSIAVMVGRVGEKSSDPIVGQLAGAIVKMSQNSRGTSSPSVPSDVQIQVLYEGSRLDGLAIAIPASQPTTTPIQLSEFHLKNIGHHVTGTVSTRLYFSKPIGSLTPIWQPTQSDEPELPFAFYSAGLTAISINAQETWNWPAFNGQISQGLKEPISAKLKVFCGSDKPTESNFVVRKKE